MGYDPHDKGAGAERKPRVRTGTSPNAIGAPVWERGGWSGLPVLIGEVHADVCVVGLGGSGLAAARELRRLDASVVGLDASGVAAGAAGRNGGFLLAGAPDFHHRAVARFGRRRAAEIYRLTLAELDRMERETPDLVRRTGSLRIAASEEELEDCRAQLEQMRNDALPAEWYAGTEGEGLLFPADGVFNPLLRCRALAAAAQREGARLFEHSPALEIVPGRVTTPLGAVACEAVVVAVDGGLERLLPELDGEVRTARLQMLATAPAPELHFPRPVYARWGMEYWQQLPDRSIALGGFRDRGGEAEWTDRGEPGEYVQALLERFLRDSLGVGASITHRWAAPVAFARAGLPLLREVRPRVWAVGGYSGTGNVIGSLAGRAAACRALGRRGEAEAVTH
jgi:gamma-glutamylputrescine oxidase